MTRLSFELAHTALQAVFMTVIIYALVFVQVFTGPRDFMTGTIMLVALFVVKAFLILMFMLLRVRTGFGLSLLMALISSVLVTLYLTLGNILSIGVEWYWLFAILVFTDLLSRLVLWDLQNNGGNAE